jgi:hypothetical protein
MHLSLHTDVFPAAKDKRRNNWRERLSFVHRGSIKQPAGLNSMEVSMQKHQ